MVSKTLVSLLMTLVIVTQLAPTNGFPRTTPHNKPGSSYLYVIGGENARETSTNANSRLDTATGKWEKMANMPTLRNRFCGAVVDKKIYLLGGYINKFFDSRTRNDEDSYTITTNDVYDCSNDTYTPLPSMKSVGYLDFTVMPDSQRIGRGCSAAVLEKSIYVTGGADMKNSLTGNFFRFDTRTNRWIKLSPIGFSASQLVELDGLFYALGMGGPRSPYMTVYNLTTNMWSTSDELANPQYECDSVVSHEGKIYSLGSIPGPGYHQEFEVYSPETNQWTTLTRPGRSDEGYSFRKLVSMNGKLWSVGGYDNTTLSDEPKLSKNLHSYDPSTDQWTEELEIDFIRQRFHSAFVVKF